MCAAASGYESCLTLLLLHQPAGAPRARLLFQRDATGKNALDWARIGRRRRCATTLQLAVQRSIERTRDDARAAEARERLRRIVEQNKERRCAVDAAVWNRDAEALRELARPL